MCKYIDEIIISIGPSFKHSAIEVINDCEDTIQFKTHPGAIYQIISNLVLNSITHAYEEDSKGTIIIKTYQSNDKIFIEYSDDGKGIDEKNMKSIFDPFFTTRRGSGGSGLGLSIVYNLITGTLKGNISAESNKGKGTQFKLALPFTT